MYDYEIKNRIPLLLAISTCPRCARMKKFLTANNVNAKIVDVDLLTYSKKKETYIFLQPINPNLSFPTLIVGDLVVIGEDYDGVKEVLRL